MANYSLVVGSKYSPFTFEELLKPALLATQAHQAIEDQYTDLSVKANVWESLANEQTDPKAYQMYKKYSNDLQNQADALSKHGLTPGSRNALLGLKKRYSQEITPIETAYTRRQKLANEQREARLKDETMMFDNDMATRSLDDFIANPELSYINYSGKTLASQVGTAAKALSKDMKDNPRKWRDILGESYYETRMQTGYTAEDIEKAILGTGDAPTELTNLVEGVLNSSGIKSWEDPTTLARAYDYAKQGLYEGIGEVQYQTLENWRAKLAEQEAAEIRNAARKLLEDNQKSLNTLAINPLNIYSSRKLKDEESAYTRSINDYSKYFTKDSKGNTILTDEGRKEYFRSTPSMSGSGTGYSVNWTPGKDKESAYIASLPDTRTAFRRFLDGLGVDEKLVKNNWNLQTVGKVWDNYVNNSPASKTAVYDSKKVTEFDYSISSEQQDDAKSDIITASRGLPLYEVDFDSESNTFKKTGDELKLSDLNTKDYTVVSTRFSPYSNDGKNSYATVLIQDKKGNTKRYILPSGINSTNEENRDKSMQAALHWNQVINTGIYVGADGKEHKATEAEILYANEKYKEALQMAHLFHSQLYNKNATKKQEYTPYGY